MLDRWSLAIAVSEVRAEKLAAGGDQINPFRENLHLGKIPINSSHLPNCLDNAQHETILLSLVLTSFIADLLKLFIRPIKMGHRIGRKIDLHPVFIPLVLKS
jgi:hypothetical protein